MNWILLSIVTLISRCIIVDWNRVYKMDGTILNFWRTLFACLIPLPFVFFVTWPTDPNFYIGAIFIGLWGAIFNISSFNLSAQFNGRIATLSNATAMLITFVLWLSINNKAWEVFQQSPVKSAIIIALMVSASIALMFMRNLNPKQKGYLSVVLTLGFFSALVTVLGKLLLPTQETQVLLSKVFLLTFIIFTCQCLFSAVFITLKHRQDFYFPRTKVKSMFVLGFLGILSSITSWLAIALAPNPAYVKAIALCAPILLLSYHKIRKIDDNANPIAGTILTLSVILLLLIQ